MPEFMPGLCRSGLSGRTRTDWDDLLDAASRLHPLLSVYLVSLGGNAIADVDAGYEEGLRSCLEVMRAGLARLVTGLLEASPGSMVVVLTPVPRLEMTPFHRSAFVTASAMFAEVVTQCGGFVLPVPDVVNKALLGNDFIANGGAGVMPPVAFDGSGVHLSRAAGLAIANAARDVVLGTCPFGSARPQISTV